MAVETLKAIRGANKKGKEGGAEQHGEAKWMGARRKLYDLRSVKMKKGES